MRHGRVARRPRARCAQPSYQLIPFPPGETAAIRLTVRERILLHLLEFTKFAESFDVPVEMTQTGIAKATRIELPHVAQYIRPLVREGQVQERTAHIKGNPRKRKVYDLSNAGRMAAIRLRDAVKTESVRVRDASGERETPVAQLLQEAGSAASLLEIVNQAMDSGFVDLSGVVARPAAATRPAFVERLADAPRLVHFVGRHTELERITGKANGTRVFVITGIAGMGKSSLAAKACELLRGSRNLFWHRVRSWDTRQSFLVKLAEFFAAVGRPRLRSVLSRGDAADADDVVRQDMPGTRALLVVDDAHVANPEVLAVLSFLKDVVAHAPDVLMLVLTRRTLSFYDRRDVVLAGLVSEMGLGGLGVEDIAALMGTGSEARALVNLGQRLGGHPLSLELLRSATPSAVEPSLGDVQKFIEEEIYRELSDGERTMMKVASLYEVPVPREVLLAFRGASHDALLALVNRAFIHRVEGDSYEVHDTIRDFFVRILTPAERESFGGFAAEQLRHLAIRAQREGDLVSCIDCLVNALELLPADVKDPDLRELLGDSYDRIGDLHAGLDAYRSALQATEAEEARARLHRKIAGALEDRGDIAAASAEVDAGLKASRAAATEERGWLDLIRCRIAYRLADWEQARDAGESALETFESLNVPAGKARILLILGHIAMHSPQNEPRLAEQHLTKALELSELVDDKEFAADVRIALAHLLAWHLQELSEALRHSAAIEASQKVAELPNVRRKFRLFQGMLRLLFFADYAAAEENFRAALDEARKVHDAATAANANVGLGYVAYMQGRYGDARRFYEEAADELKARGLLVDTVNLLLAISETYLLEGDQPTSTQVFIQLMSEPSLSKAIDARSFYIRLGEGYFLLLQGDKEGAITALADAVGRATARSGIGEGTMTFDFVGCISWPGVYALLYSGVALRFLGRREEGDQQIARAQEIAQAHGAKVWLEAMPKLERRLTEILEGLLGKPAPES